MQDLERFRNKVAKDEEELLALRESLTSTEARFAAEQEASQAKVFLSRLIDPPAVLISLQSFRH